LPQVQYIVQMQALHVEYIDQGPQKNLFHVLQYPLKDDEQDEYQHQCQQKPKSLFKIKIFRRQKIVCLLLCPLNQRFLSYEMQEFLQK
jgi:hypothetical protein